MKEQFGFDDRTVDILWDIYEAVQKLYADLPQKERDWYFARAISQLGDYNDKPVKILFFSVETHAWRKGAGWAYKYDEEEEFFCKKLGLSEGDYKYIRQMVRLQHFMTSDPEGYNYTNLNNLYLNKKMSLIFGKIRWNNLLVKIIPIRSIWIYMYNFILKWVLKEIFPI